MRRNCWLQMTWHVCRSIPKKNRHPASTVCHMVVCGMLGSGSTLHHQRFSFCVCVCGLQLSMILSVGHGDHLHSGTFWDHLHAKLMECKQKAVHGRSNQIMVIPNLLNSKHSSLSLSLCICAESRSRPCRTL